jgi:hypothetical protein
MDCGALRRLLLFWLAVAAAFPASASAIDRPVPLPEGAAISDSLEYVGRVESPGLVEGKFDRVRGRSILITTGRFGSPTYDVRDSAKPRLLDTFRPLEVLGENGYWQDEDMDIDARRKLIIGALDPRHDDVRQDLCPGDRQRPARRSPP